MDKYTVETNSYGNKYYYKNDKLHRDGDLPAVIWTNGYKKYWINGKEISEEEYYIRLCKERNITNKQRLIYYICEFERFVEVINKNRNK